MEKPKARKTAARRTRMPESPVRLSRKSPRKAKALSGSQALARSNDLLDRVFASPHHLIAYLDQDFNFLRVSRAYAKADGHAPDYYVGKNHFALFPNPDNESIFRKVVDTGIPYHAVAKPFEYAEHPERGPSYWDWSLYPLTEASGKVAGLVLNLVDVTPRICAEQDLQRVNRSLRTISECNEILIRAQDEESLLCDICGVIVKSGGYRAASVGLYDEPSGHIRLATFVGADPQLQASAREGWADGEMGPSLMGNAIRTGEPQLAQDLAHAPVHAAWRERARRAGFGSAIALPLASDGATVGALMIFAAEADAFDAAQIELLTELAGDLAFGIQSLRGQAARQRAEAAVRQQAELLELAHEAVFVRDLNNRILYWNRGAEETYGWTREQVLGNVTHMFLATEFPVPLPEIERQVMTAGRWDGDLVHRTADGRRIIVASRWALQRDADGQPFAFLEVNRDVTQARRSEEEIRRLYAEVHTYASELEQRVRERTSQLEDANEDLEIANEELRVEIEQREEAEKQLRLNLTALESAANAVVITDLTGAIVWVNPAFSQLTGYSREEAIGHNPRVLKSGAHDEAFYRDLWSTIVAGQVWRGELVNRRKDGSTYMEEMAITPVRQAGGKVTHFIAIKQDITERTAADRAIRESEERFRRIFDEGPLGMAVVGLDFRLNRVNARICQMLGYSEAELTTRTIQEITHPADVHEDMEFAHRLMNGEIPYYRIEKRYLKKSGDPVWVELTASLIRDHAGRPIHFLGMVEDISDRKRSEQAIQKLNLILTSRAEDLAAANRELEAFSYSVSHDLRTPLSAIQGFSDILIREHTAQLDPAGQTFLRLVHDNAQYTTQLVQGLLAFSRFSRQSLEKTRVSMQDLVRQSIEKLSSERQGRQVEFVIGDLPDGEGDPILLLQVWVNLISNAVKYSRSRKVARIEVSSIVGDKGQGAGDEGGSEEKGSSGTLPGTRHESTVTYYVRDNGVGFDMSHAEHLFGVFQRLHDASEYEGTGVGLAIVQRIVHRHGGRIWADAEVDKGATFYFTLD